MDADDLYSEIILDHFKHPKNAGVLENPSLTLSGVNPLCGDKVQFTLQITDGVILAVRFEAKGCSISRAAASMVSEMASGISLADALGLQGTQVLEQFGNIIQLRQKCALLPLHVLHEGIKEHTVTGTKDILNLSI